jgi:hypothetical protein
MWMAIGRIWMAIDRIWMAAACGMSGVVCSWMAFAVAG